MGSNPEKKLEVENLVTHSLFKTTLLYTGQSQGNGRHQGPGRRRVIVEVCRS